MSQELYLTLRQTGQNARQDGSNAFEALGMHRPHSWHALAD